MKCTSELSHFEDEESSLATYKVEELLLPLTNNLRMKSRLKAFQISSSSMGTAEIPVYNLFKREENSLVPTSKIHCYTSNYHNFEGYH